MSKAIDLTGLSTIKNWMNQQFLRRSELSDAVSLTSTIKISFGSDFVGQVYTMTGGTNEVYMGVVPTTLTMDIRVYTQDTTYNISCNTADGELYERTIPIDKWYGVYPFEFLSFLAYLTVQADAGATIRVVGSKKSYTGVADSKGFCTFDVGEADTYSVTSTLNGETTPPMTVDVLVSGESYTYKCPSLIINIVSWRDGSDEEISAILDAAKVGLLDLQKDAGWAVGDIRTISISAFTGGGSVSHAAQNVDIAISSFENYMDCGCVMQFDFVKYLASANRMNPTNTNAGGYETCEMYTTTLPALVEALPTWLRERLVEFSVLASAGTNSTRIATVTGNKLALRSEIEVFGTYQDSKEGEGIQVEYYKTSANRVKGKNWWTRSANLYYSNGFNHVLASASRCEGYYASSTSYVSPFGCI